MKICIAQYSPNQKYLNERSLFDGLRMNKAVSGPNRSCVKSAISYRGIDCTNPATLVSTIP